MKVSGRIATPGGVPVQLQTDQSSTATHTLDRMSKKRGFNTWYLALCAHYDVEPTTIHVACPNENGDIESANGRKHPAGDPLAGGSGVG